MKRFYFALTNKCNRTCKYCSCFSRPNRTTFLSFDKIKSYIDPFVGRISGDKDDFEIQLEGGEPLLHPEFYDIIEYAIKTNRCSKVILTSNFAEISNLKEFFDRVNFDNLNKFLVKPSINYELYKDEPNFFEKMFNIKDIIQNYTKFELKFNVRLDKTEYDALIMENLRKYDLETDSNIFYYQRYGYASDNENFDLPFVIDNPVDFHLISPDGKDFGMNMIARSEHMRNLI